MIDAELAEGDLNQITSAIQNALKPVTVVQQRLPAQLTAALPSEREIVDGDAERDATPQGDEEQSDAGVASPAREVRIRKPTPMKVLELDLTSETSFENFAQRHIPKSDTERNLVVLAWFKEFRSDEAVTADHVYTCYRTMKWPSGIEDFPSTLRRLKAQQLVTSPSRRVYVINHLGIARVEKLGQKA